MSGSVERALALRLLTAALVGKAKPPAPAPPPSQPQMSTRDPSKLLSWAEPSPDTIEYHEADPAGSVTKEVPSR